MGGGGGGGGGHTGRDDFTVCGAHLAKCKARAI